MHIGLVVIGIIMWLAVYGAAVLIAVHQYGTSADSPRQAAAVFVGKAAPYLIAFLLNGVLALRYPAGAVAFAAGTLASFVLTWIIVAVARRQLHGRG